MAEEFILDCKVDQPFVLTGKREELSALVTIRPNISKIGALLEKAGDVALPAHLIVVVDVSASMQLLIRDDPHARLIGTSTSEGQNVKVVQSNVPSRLAVAQSVVKTLTDRMGPSDRMTLVAFDHEAHVLASAASAGGSLTNAIEQLSDTGGGGTSMGKGLQAVAIALRAARDSTSTHKLVVLTDGEDQEPDFALEQAQLLGAEYQVPIHAFGTGESRGDFIKQICQMTLGAFQNITTEDEAEQSFDAVLSGQKNILATNVKLSIWLSPEIHVRDLYRTKPEILYVDKMRPDANNQLEFPILYMERGKSYEFLFRCEVPKREIGRFRLAKVALFYDIPALSVTNQKVEANITVEYTADAERAQMQVGDVRRVKSQAEVQRQVLYLQEKIDQIGQNRATEKDKLMVARMLDNLIKKFEEFGDQPNRNMYVKIRDEYQKNGTISQQTLNQSLAASSKVEETVGVQEIDDF